MKLKLLLPALLVFTMSCKVMFVPKQSADALAMIEKGSYLTNKLFTGIEVGPDRSTPHGNLIIQRPSTQLTRLSLLTKPVQSQAICLYRIRSYTMPCCVTGKFIPPVARSPKAWPGCLRCMYNPFGTHASIQKKL